jgi:ribosome-binding protein aMBF1 (putative translation factor)
MPTECTHLNQIKITETDKHVCEDCIKTGDKWVHLRSSKNKHATKHFHKTQHPLIRSNEPGESWVWCYVDEIEAGEIGA